jgi:hypothetical protein
MNECGALGGGSGAVIEETTPDVPVIYPFTQELKRIETPIRHGANVWTNGPEPYPSFGSELAAKGSWDGQKGLESVMTLGKYGSATFQPACTASLAEEPSRKDRRAVSMAFSSM